MPSGTKAYYSFTHSTVHFIVLNSYDVSRWVGMYVHSHVAYASTVSHTIGRLMR